MTINNPDVYFDGIWDWACLDGCFKETKIKPTDIDGFVERNGRFLVLETKHPGARIPYGQEITFTRMVETGLFTVIVIWGEKNAPEEIELRTSKTTRHYDDVDNEKLRQIVTAWFEWAENQTPTPRFTE